MGLVAELARLADLHQQGALDDEEYARVKSALLAGTAPRDTADEAEVASGVGSGSTSEDRDPGNDAAEPGQDTPPPGAEGEGVPPASEYHPDRPVWKPLEEGGYATWPALATPTSVDTPVIGWATMPEPAATAMAAAVRLLEQVGEITAREGTSVTGALSVGPKRSNISVHIDDSDGETKATFRCWGRPALICRQLLRKFLRDLQRRNDTSYRPVREGGLHVGAQAAGLLVAALVTLGVVAAVWFDTTPEAAGGRSSAGGGLALSLADDGECTTDDFIGTYCIYAMQVKNVGDEPITIDSRQLRLVDAQNREHAPDSHTDFYGSLNPGQGDVVVVTFDLPEDTTPEALQLSTSGGSARTSIATSR